MTLKSKTSVRKNIAEDVVSRGISSIMERNSIWVGTMTELVSALNRVLSKKQRTLLPGSPSALRVIVNRVVNRIRNRGIGVRFGRTADHVRTRFVRFAR